MFKINIKITKFIKKISLLFLLIFSGILIFNNKVNNFNYYYNNNNNKVKQFLNQKEDFNFKTKDLDWSGFNSSDKYLPTWEIDTSSLSFQDYSYVFGFMIDGNSTGLPNGGNSGEPTDETVFTDFNSLQYYVPFKSGANLKSIAYGQNNPNSLDYESNDSAISWIRYKGSVNYNNPNSELYLAIYGGASGNNGWKLVDPSKLDNPEGFNFKYTKKARPTEIISFDYDKDSISKDSVNLLFNIDKQLGNGDIKITANGNVIYDKTNLESGEYNLKYNWNSNTKYDFKIYADNNDSTKEINLLSPNKEINVIDFNVFQSKENYEFSDSKNNGVGSGYLILSNPDNIKINNVNFNIGSEIINSTISSDDPNKFIFLKDELGEGVYNVNYVIEYEDNEGRPKNLTSDNPLLLEITSKTISEPQVNIPGLTNIKLPSTPTWNNGSAEVELTIDNPDENVSIKKIETILNKNGSDQDSEEHNPLNEKNSIYNINFSNLTKGEYYLKYAVNYEIKNGESLESKLISGETEKVILIDNELFLPTLVDSSLEIKNYFDDLNKGSIKGTIDINGFESIIDSKVNIELKDIQGNIVDSASNIIINSEGVINVSFENLINKEYILHIKGKSNLNSNEINKEFDLKIDNLILNKEEFNVPDFYLSWTEFNGNTILTFHSVSNDASSPWGSVTGAKGTVKVQYIDGAIKEFNFSETDGEISSDFPQIIFKFSNDNNSGVLGVDVKFSVTGNYEDWEQEGTYKDYSELSSFDTSNNNNNNILLYTLVPTASIIVILGVGLASWLIFKKLKSK